ncbi:MAG: HDIG domain-containing protein [Coprobacter sp.]|nr:HDIG domain-containing protein [Coprobacter sp.]
MASRKIKAFFSRQTIFQSIFFIAAVSLTVYFFPGEGKFRYHFQEGQPWRYGLLTAPFDFPMYKSEAQLQSEKDSILKDFQPFYRIDPNMGARQLESLETAYRTSLREKLPSYLYLFLQKEIEAVYQQGIVSTADYERMLKEQTPSIRVLENQKSRTYLLSELSSPRMAYEKIIEKLPDEGSRSIAHDCNLNNFLVENLTFDEHYTQQARDNRLRKISPSSKVIQAGEKIIDRGEIVSPYTYQILKSLETVTLKKSANLDRQEIALLGKSIVVICLFGFFFLYLALFRPKIFNDGRRLGFLLLMIVAVTLTAFFTSRLRVLGIYIVPFAILPIIVVTFIDSRTALYTHLVTVLLCAFAAPFPMEFIFLQIIIGMTAIDTLNELVKRSQLVRCVIFVFLAYAVSYSGYTLLTEGDWTKINWNMFAYFGGSSVLLLLAYLLIYLLEKTFGFISNVTLVELSDINSSILRQLSEVCPGTFQHSMQVSNLAAEAAIKIGANAQLVRTGALYHDIGKLSNPAFFTENQSGVNPHQSLSYPQSAQIIIQHVKDGMKAADKEMLPQAIKDFIATHHGKGKTKFFYNSYKNEFPDAEIDESVFTYPGPNPFTKETAILMMADSVEAASRSLKEYTAESIASLVNNIIDGQIADGLMKDAPISFQDVEKIKQTFIEKLKTMYHTRISYPELKKENGPKAEKSEEKEK